MPDDPRSTADRRVSGRATVDGRPPRIDLGSPELMSLLQELRAELVAQHQAAPAGGWPVVAVAKIIHANGSSQPIIVGSYVGGGPKAMHAEEVVDAQVWPKISPGDSVFWMLGQQPCTSRCDPLLEQRTAEARKAGVNMRVFSPVFVSQGGKTVEIEGVQHLLVTSPKATLKDPDRKPVFYEYIDFRSILPTYRETSGSVGGESGVAQSGMPPSRPRQDVGSRSSAEPGSRLTPNRIAGPEREAQLPLRGPKAPAPYRGSPSPAAGATLSETGRGAGAAWAIFLAAAYLLNRIGDEIQRRDAEAEYKKYERDVANFLQSNPELGVLVVFTFTQLVSIPSGEGSLVPPGAHFRSVDFYYGRTRMDAEAKRIQAGKIEKRDEPVYRSENTIRQYLTEWIPPLRYPLEAPQQKRTEGPERHAMSTPALAREIKVDLKPPANFVRIFHLLNGSSMKQMLQALNDLKRSGQLDLLSANFDKAEGVNKGRIHVAVRATFLRGSPQAFQVFMADERNHLELAGVETEGKEAIERVLLTNRDD